MPTTEVRVPVFLTESKERVLRAVANVLDVEVSSCVEEGSGDERFVVIRCLSNDFKPLEKLRSLLRAYRILDAARSYLERGLRDGTLRFYLNKQAAYAGKVSFCTYEFGESPLGAITISVHLEECDSEKFLNWLAPRTHQGKPVGREQSVLGAVQPGLNIARLEFAEAENPGRARLDEDH